MFYSLKAFVMEEIYTASLLKVFLHARREKNMGLLLNIDKKKKK